MKMFTNKILISWNCLSYVKNLNMRKKELQVKYSRNVLGITFMKFPFIQKNLKIQQFKNYINWKYSKNSLFVSPKYSFL